MTDIAQAEAMLNELRDAKALLSNNSMALCWSILTLEADDPHRLIRYEKIRVLDDHISRLGEEIKKLEMLYPSLRLPVTDDYDWFRPVPPR